MRQCGTELPAWCNEGCQAPVSLCQILTGGCVGQGGGEGGSWVGHQVRLPSLVRPPLALASPESSASRFG
jgi:hypothetical protein